MTFHQLLVLEGARCVTAAVLLLLTWGLGQRILFSWDARKKRQELDLATSSEFYALYGVFKDISKQWRIMLRQRGRELIFPDHVRWDLLSRACSLESRNEAILMKLSAERLFTLEQVKTLGLFRQAFQQLREAIRDNDEVDSSSRGLEYSLFNALSAEVASIIASKHPMRQIPSRDAVNNLHSIAKVTRRDFLEAISSLRTQSAQLGENEI